MAERDPSQRVVVTGMGMVSPLGLNVESSWLALINSGHGIENIRETLLKGYPESKVKTSLGAPVNGFDLVSNPHFKAGGINIVKNRKNWHRSSELALAAALQAMRQAGLTDAVRIDQAVIEAERFGVSIGSGIGGATVLTDTRMELETKEEPRVYPNEILNALPARPSEVVSMVFGPGEEESPIAFEEALFEECATGNANIANAADQIRLGRADVVLAGGTEGALEPVTIAEFEATRAVDPSTDKNWASRPFDRDAAGLVFGEGAGVLVLESYEHARRRGATVLAELVGYGKSADAYKDTSPSGYGAVLALKRALADTRLEASDISGYINAHATSTGEADGTELWAISQLLSPEQFGISSTKGATGHTFGAAGAIEAIFSIMAARTGIMPPSLKLDNPIEQAKNWRMSPHEATDIAGGIDLAINNSFGFGGPNYVTIWSRG